MIGNTPIPPEVGTTVTGAITNLYNGMDTDEFAGWTLVKSYNPTAGWNYDSSSDIMSIFNNHKKFLSVTGASNGSWIGDYQIHDLDKLYANGFLSASTTYYFTHLYSTNCMACCGWESSKFAYTGAGGYQIRFYVKN